LDAFTASAKRKSATCGICWPRTHARATCTCACCSSSTKHVKHLAASFARLQELLNANALGDAALTGDVVARVRAEMEKAHAQRLQPNFIEAFWVEAYKRLNGAIADREPGRYELPAVPPEVRSRAKHLDSVKGAALRYERVTFEKGLMLGPPLAEFVSPGHPILAATIDLTLERARSSLAQGAILIDDSPFAKEAKVLLYVDDMINSSATDEHGGQRTVSRRLAFVALKTKTAASPQRDSHRTWTFVLRRRLKRIASGTRSNLIGSTAQRLVASSHRMRSHRSPSRTLTKCARASSHASTAYQPQSKSASCSWLLGAPPASRGAEGR